MKLDEKARIYADSIRKLYLEKDLSLRDIERIMHEDYHIRLTKDQIRVILKRRGIDTTKRTGLHRKVTCRTCGREKDITRARHRDAKGFRIGKRIRPHTPWHHYCDWHCRRVWLEEHCRHQQDAIRLVEYLLGRPLPAGAVAHFIDNDSTNVIKNNIRIFTSTQRHLDEHRALDKDEE